MKKQLTAGALAGMVLALAGSAPASADEEPSVDDRVIPTIMAGSLSRLAAYNTTATVSFTINMGNRPLARRTVRVCFAPIGGTWACTNATTTAAGKVDARRIMTTTRVQVNVVVPESTSNQSATSDTVVLTPQVTVKVTRSRATMTVVLNHAAGQYLVVKRQEGPRWLVDRVQQVAGNTTTLTGMETANRYHIVIGDTPSVKGNVSATV